MDHGFGEVRILKGLPTKVILSNDLGQGLVTQFVQAVIRSQAWNVDCHTHEDQGNHITQHTLGPRAGNPNQPAHPGVRQLLY